MPQPIRNVSLYGQRAADSAAYIVGDRSSLIRLRNLIESALASDSGASLTIMGEDETDTGHIMVACCVSARVNALLARPFEKPTATRIHPQSLPEISALVSGEAHAS